MVAVSWGDELRINLLRHMPPIPLWIQIHHMISSQCKQGFANCRASTEPGTSGLRREIMMLVIGIGVFLGESSNYCG